MPRMTVPRDNPLALATAVTPPKPRASASAAATKRRVRSSRTRARTSNLCAKPPASSIAASIEHFHSTCSIYFVTVPNHAYPHNLAGSVVVEPALVYPIRFRLERQQASIRLLHLGESVF